MKYMFNVFLTFLERIAILLVIIAMATIIFSRVDKLMNTGIVSQVEKNFSNEEDVLVQRDGAAPIIYKGQNAQAHSEDEDSAAQLIEGSQRQSTIVSFEIYEGQSAEEVSAMFLDLGLIQSPGAFVHMLEEQGLRDAIRPGGYDVPSDIKNLDLIETITVSTAIQELEMENPELAQPAPEDPALEEIPQEEIYQDPVEP